MKSISSRRTPVSPEYPSCDECYASLLIYPDLVHPDEVSRILNLEPTNKNIVGTQVTNSRGRVREITIAGWFLSSKGYVHSKDLREHLNWLLTRIEPSSDALSILQDYHGVTMSIDCVWRSLAGNGGPVLWPEQMKRMSALNLECGFDIYFVGDES